MQSTVSLNSTGSQTRDGSIDLQKKSTKYRLDAGLSMLIGNSFHDKSSVATEINPDSKQSNQVGTRKCSTPTTLVVQTNQYNRQFEFDAILDSTSTHKDVYDVAVGDSIHQVMKGCNTTIIAYGQTGSG
jgi:Kinesin motor domain